MPGSGRSQVGPSCPCPLYPRHHPTPDSSAALARQESNNMVVPAMQLASKIPDMSVQLWSSALLRGEEEIGASRQSRSLEGPRPCWASALDWASAGHNPSSQASRKALFEVNGIICAVRSTQSDSDSLGPTRQFLASDWAVNPGTWPQSPPHEWGQQSSVSNRTSQGAPQQVSLLLHHLQIVKPASTDSPRVLARR